MWAAPSGHSPDLKGEWQKDYSSLACLTFPAVAEVDSFADMEPVVSRLLSLTEKQWLFRNPPGLGHQVGTDEAPIAVN